MRDKLRALAKLAAMDGAAQDYDRELQELPAKIASMREDVQTLEALLARERDQLTEATTLEGERSSELTERREALSRAKAKGAKARTIKEADAAEREVESNRRIIRDREEELERIRATIEAKKSSLEERERQFEEARGIFEEEEKAASARIAEVEALRATVLDGRETLETELPRTIMKRYERLKQARLREGNKYAVLAVLESETCTSCRVALPPQLFIEVMRGEDYFRCPSCKAFVVYKGLLDEGDDSSVPAADAGDAPAS
ncbi:MAG: C4-type zinc ribbon domain-containing protein [Myxococcota bacterium]